MPILDHENLFSWKQSITGDAFSTNVIDLWGPDAGGGQPEAVEVIAEPVDGTTLVVTVQTSEQLATGYEDLQSYDISEASMAKGGNVGGFHLPLGMKQYARLSYTADSGPAVVTAGIIDSYQSNDYGKKKYLKE